MTISHAISNIQRYRKRYGLSKAFRAIIHYLYVASNKTRVKSPKIDTIEVNGYKLQVMINDPLGTSSELLMFRKHEPVTTEIVSKTLQKGMICLDIGGNIGYYVLLESKIVENEGRVVAIEPSPENFRYLMNNLQLSKTSNVEAFNIAVGNVEGTTNFLIYKGASNSGMVIQEGQKPAWPGTIIQVPIRTIDSLLTDMGLKKIDFVRMDVEGYEDRVIDGMKNTLQSSKPIIQIEMHASIMGNENTKKLLNRLQQIGYDVKYYVPRDIDTPLIGTMKDVKHYNIEKILSMLEDQTLPSFIMLTLENHNRV